MQDTDFEQVGCGTKAVRGCPELKFSIKSSTILCQNLLCQPKQLTDVRSLFGSSGRDCFQAWRRAVWSHDGS